MIKDRIRDILDELVVEDVPYSVEIPNESFGDYSTNVAMKLAGRLKKNPLEIANSLKDRLCGYDMFDSVEVVNGFINLRLKDEVYISALNDMDFNKNKGRGEVLVEFGSANPTGPMHVGHGLGLVIGDMICSLLEYYGYEVTREYYINDYGVQVDNLVESLKINVKKILGEEVDLEEQYKGEYVKEMAQDFVSGGSGDLKTFALNWCLSDIRKTLQDLGVNFNSWVSEESLHQNDSLNKLIEKLKKDDLVYENEGALWLRTTKYGDEKDRVVVKNDGMPSYFASDLLYSKHKSSRGYEKIITILGADHHGYVQRYVASFGVAGFEGEVIVKLAQIVSFLRSGEKVRMSKRAGNFFTLQDLIDEVGRDACRVMFISKKMDTPIEFDIDKAKEKKLDNPIFYMQYAYARICSLLKKVPEEGCCEVISSEEDKRLIKKLSEFREAIKKSAEELEPHKLFIYATELSSLFHSFYNSEKIMNLEPKAKVSKIAIAKSVKRCLEEVFKIFKISALEEM